MKPRQGVHDLLRSGCVGSPRLLERPEGGDELARQVHRQDAAGLTGDDPQTELVTDLSALLGDVHLDVEGASDAVGGGAVHGVETHTILQHQGELTPLALQAGRDGGGQVDGVAHGRVHDQELADVTLVILGVGPTVAVLGDDLLLLPQAVVAVGAGLEGEDGTALVRQHVAEQAAGGGGLVKAVVLQVEPVRHGLQVRRITAEAEGEPGVLHLVGLDDDVQDLAGLQTVVAVGLVDVGRAVAPVVDGAVQVVAVDDLALLPCVGGGGEAGVGVLGRGRTGVRIDLRRGVGVQARGRVLGGLTTAVAVPQGLAVGVARLDALEIRRAEARKGLPRQAGLAVGGPGGGGETIGGFRDAGVGLGGRGEVGLPVATG